jgi:hypothetical protein
MVRSSEDFPLSRGYYVPFVSAFFFFISVVFGVSFLEFTGCVRLVVGSWWFHFFF